MKEETSPERAEGIEGVRGGKVRSEQGYDGEFGKIKIFDKEREQGAAAQKSLF